MPRVGEFNAQYIANIAWASATVDQQNEALFASPAVAATTRLGEFSTRYFANLPWALAKVD